MVSTCAPPPRYRPRSLTRRITTGMSDRWHGRGRCFTTRSRDLECVTGTATRISFSPDSTDAAHRSRQRWRRVEFTCATVRTIPAARIACASPPAWWNTPANFWWPLGLSYELVSELQGAPQARGGEALRSNGMRRATIDRRTTETRIGLRLSLDGKGRYDVHSGIRFLDHMLELFARHGAFDLKLAADGDLDVDQHHTVEDIGIALGEAVSAALGNRRGINRAGYFVMPMDETLAVAAIDLGGRIHAV